MGQEEVNRIKSLLLELELKPTYLEHEEVITSQDAAKTRGFELKQGIKALLFTNDNDQWVIVDVPADKKVDAKKVAEILGWSKSKIRMANQEEVLQKTGCEIGAVPPFGHKEIIQILVDLEVYNNQDSAFNIGLRTQSLKIKTESMKIVFEKVGAREGKYVKIDN
ncbi:YbaK/EbsC family protein [Candidatus Woesearchaeota archaeon]|nr:YbaK/EbsC family protein [Candidatus Woesearchaeota archaeon]